MSENYEHQHYKHCDIKEADAVAWAFVSIDKMVQFPFKFEELRDNEIRVNILYAGLCLSDVHAVRGTWGPCPYPLSPGHEIVGEVSLVGKNVQDFKKGDIVGFGSMRDCCDQCKFCLTGKEHLCRNSDDNFVCYIYWAGYATAMQQPAKFFFHLPEGFKYEKAAPLFCAGITVYYPIERYLTQDIKTTGVIGCGGLGHMAIQFLHKMGRHVTAFTTSENKRELLTKLGADKMLPINWSKFEAMKPTETITKIEVTISTKAEKLGKWQGAFGSSTGVVPEYWYMTEDMEQFFDSKEGTLTWEISKEVSDAIQSQTLGQIKFGVWWVDSGEFTIETCTVYTDAGK